MKKWLFLLIFAAAAGGGWYYWQQQEAAAALPPGLLTSNGCLELERFDVASLYPGRVERMLVEEGDMVAQDAVLAELSSAQALSRPSRRLHAPRPRLPLTASSKRWQRWSWTAPAQCVATIWFPQAR